MPFETARPNYLAVLSEKREHFWQISGKWQIMQEAARNAKSKGEVQ